MDGIILVPGQALSLAPLEVVISLDHTHGVTTPGLDYVAHRGDGVLLGLVFQYVITIVTIISTCNNNGVS